MSLNFKTLLVLTLAIVNASTNPIDKLSGNTSSFLTSLNKSKNNISDETRSLLSNSSDFETIEIRRKHIDEERPISRATNSDENVVGIDNLKYEVEILQPGRIEKENIEIEERFKAPSLNFDTNEFFEENIEVNSETVQRNHVALTAALFIFAIVSVGIYAGLVIWRAKLEKRYGMRQRLMTEDDFCTNVHDIRPF